MSPISVWILSITGIIVLSVVVDLVLPNGSTSKFIKNIFAFVIVIVIISPVIMFFSNKNLELDDFFKENSVVVQQDFIANINRKKLNKVEYDVKKTLKANGISGVGVGVMADVFAKELEVTQVSIDLSQIVIDKNFSHIDIKKSIIEIVLRFVKVKKSQIIFYDGT
ncbi:MAG: stage III sporulation protein AF [Clostridia bacterium]|jgi:stage III sporulation protein AF|nr:stage III sporulation protein AF [Clostridia bacterium]MDD3232035.1 stage III sporulation protein AF [Clostridia bacterium]MDD3862290.1 stage III sporulation protein AF [Clostridia bacterium]MDD4408518.1 stage III sporulation protein AF [Clostridia bacterium]